jgi:hypothetical protein
LTYQYLPAVLKTQLKHPYDAYTHITTILIGARESQPVLPSFVVGAWFPEGAKSPRRGLVVRMPTIGGGENAPCFSYSYSR